jgi:hypothetical protein
MGGQNAMRSEIPIKPSAAMDGAPLKLEQFLPYQLNLVAALVSEVLSQVYARRYRIARRLTEILTLGDRDAFEALYGRSPIDRRNSWPRRSSITASRTM